MRTAHASIHIYFKNHCENYDTWLINIPTHELEIPMKEDQRQPYSDNQILLPAWREWVKGCEGGLRQTLLPRLTNK